MLKKKTVNNMLYDKLRCEQNFTSYHCFVEMFFSTSVVSKLNAALKIPVLPSCGYKTLHDHHPPVTLKAKPEFISRLVN